MRRFSLHTFFCLFLIIFLSVLPTAFSSKIQRFFIGAFCKNSPDESESFSISEYEQFKLMALKEWIFEDKRVDACLERLSQAQKLNSDEEYWKNFFLRRKEELEKEFLLKSQMVFAKVVFRDPSFWNHHLWINSGEKMNTSLGIKVIAKNSPVLKGDSIIGIVEEVHETKSLIRLISDPTLVASVRAMRGPIRERYLRDLILNLEDLLLLRDDIGVEKKERALFALSELRGEDLEERYLAKGELVGSLSTSFRTHSSCLKGVGFNYDFADEEGPARDLREKDLLNVGDLLITTGMDGVFPSNFKVATVSKVSPLQEGSVSYDIEAFSTAGDLQHIDTVWVLPPLILSDF